MSGRRGKRSYLRDFQANDSGEYEYRGKLWKTALEAAEYRAVRRRYTLCAGLALLLTIAAGCFPAGVMEAQLYVLLPYVIALVLEARLLLAAYRLYFEQHEEGVLRDYIYERSADRIPRETETAAGFAIITLAANLIAKAFRHLQHLPAGSFALVSFWCGIIVFNIVISIQAYRESTKMQFQQVQ